MSDETLMAYADGQLSKPERKQLAAMLEASPELRQRLQAFLATGNVLAEPFNAPMNEPVPQHLVDLVMNGASPAEARHPAPGEAIRGKSGSPRGGRVLLLEWLSWPAALASALSLTIGIGAGSHLAKTSVPPPERLPSLAAIGADAVVAEGALADALERAKSKVQVAVPAQGAASPGYAQANMTFRSESGYCRQYELAPGGGMVSVGIACRDERGKWRLEFHAATKSQPQAEDTTLLSSGLAAAGLAAVRKGLMVGDAFGPDEEQAALARGWRR